MRVAIFCAAIFSLAACHSDLAPAVAAHCDGLEKMLQAQVAGARRGVRPRPVSVFGSNAAALHREFVFCAQTHVGDFGAQMNEFMKVATQVDSAPAATGPNDAALADSLEALAKLVHDVNAAPLRR